MTDAAADARTDRPRRAPKVGGQGQWALGETQPLNANERWKQEDDGLNVRERIEDVYSQAGLRLDQRRRPARAVPLVGALHPAQARASTAARPPRSSRTSSRTSTSCSASASTAAPLTTEQLRVIGEISARLRPRHRRHHRPAEHPAALDPGRGRARDLAPARGRRPADHRGLRRRARASSSAPRSPGIARDEIIDPTPQIEEIQRPLHRRPRARQPAAQVQVRDHRHARARTSCTRSTTSRFVGVVHPELGAGYDLWVGGGLSTNPRLAERLGAFVRPRRPPTCGTASSRIFRDYGYRRLRTQGAPEVPARRLGPGEVPRRCSRTEYLERRSPTARARAQPTTRGDHVGVHEQKDGRFFVGAAPLVGRISGDQLTELADLVEAARLRPRVRTTPHQKLVVLDVAPGRASTRSSPALDALGPRRPRRSLFRRAHHGLHRHRVLQARDRRDQGHRGHARSPSSSSGSPTSPTSSTPRSRSTSTAARTPAPASRPPTSASRASSSTTDGEQVPGFQVHLGGGLASAGRDEAGLGRTVRGLKVTADDLPDYVERVVRRFARPTASAGETFANGPPRRRGGTPVTTYPVPLRSTHARRASRSPRRELDEPRTLRRARRARARATRRRGRRLGGPQLRAGTLAVACSMADAVLPAPRRRAARPASTCSSSTPATTSPRPRDPRRGRRATCDVTIVDVAAASRPSPSRTPSTAPSSSSATPPCAAPCARSSRCGRALGGYEVWVTGVRRDEAPDPRRHARSSPGTSKHGLVKVNPLAAWTFDDVVAYADRARRAPVNPLLCTGYPSIGCEPCTPQVAPGDDPRAGRWAGTDKTECGLHA